MVSESVDPPGADAGVETIGALLSRVRLEQGKSQLRIAELLCAASGQSTLTRHEISRWEREERIPSGTWLRWLAVVLDTPLDELERAAAVSRGLRGPAMSAATLTVISWPAGPRPRVTSDDRPVAPESGLGADTTRAQFRTRLSELRHMDDLIAAPELAGLVHRELRAVLTGPVAARLRQAQPRPGSVGVEADAPSGSRAERERLSLIGGLAQLAHWVAADAGAPVSSLATHRLGLRAAELAGDQPLAAHLMSCVAQLATEAGDGPAGLRQARAAIQTGGATTTATSRALLAVRLAHAAAVAGELRQCEQAIGLAERAWQQHDPGVDPEWVYWLDEATFSALLGRCYAALRRPLSARPLLLAALKGNGVRFRARALTQVALAHAHVAAGELDAACATAGEALITCVRSGSLRATRQALALAPVLPTAARSGSTGVGGPARAAASAANRLTEAPPASSAPDAASRGAPGTAAVGQGAPHSRTTVDQSAARGTVGQGASVGAMGRGASAAATAPPAALRAYLELLEECRPFLPIDAWGTQSGRPLGRKEAPNAC
jgi:transcriptional regulator with XRE-family HTH domain